MRPPHVLALTLCFAALLLACLPRPEARGASSAPPPAVEGDARAAARGVQSFTGRALSPVFEGSGDVVASPYSISSALHLALLGARGETRAELEATLGTDAAAGGHANMGALGYALWSDAEGAPTVRVANRVWLDRAATLAPAYLDGSAAFYGAEPGALDFRGDPERSRGAINAWVSERTEAVIPELLSPGAVHGGTRAVLTNAVYFRGDWADPFVAELTRPGDFHVPGEGPTSARFMVKESDLLYAEAPDRQVVGLPYEGGEWTLYVVLPAPGAHASVGRELASSGFAGSLPTDTARVHLRLPRFRASWSAALREVLEEAGLNAPFDPRRADFSGMLATRGVSFSDVIHEAVIEVDETGTVAAAATAVMMEVTTSLPPEPVVMHVDRPFFFVLHHGPTDTPFFVGRVWSPVDPG